jgi:hypothetical protein
MGIGSGSESRFRSVKPGYGSEGWDLEQEYFDPLNNNHLAANKHSGISRTNLSIRVKQTAGQLQFFNSL